MHINATGRDPFTNGNNERVGRFLEQSPGNIDQITVTFNNGPSSLTYQNAPGRGSIAKVGRFVVYGLRNEVYCVVSIDKKFGFPRFSGMSTSEKTTAEDSINAYLAELRATFQPQVFIPEQRAALGGQVDEEMLSRMVDLRLQTKLDQMEAEAQAARELQAEKDRKVEEFRKEVEEREAHKKRIAAEFASVQEMKEQLKKQVEACLQDELRRKAEFEAESKRINTAAAQELMVVPTARQPAPPAIDINTVLLIGAIVALGVAMLTTQRPAPVPEPPRQDNTLAAMFALLELTKQSNVPPPDNRFHSENRMDKPPSSVFDGLFGFVIHVFGYTVGAYFVLSIVFGFLYMFGCMKDDSTDDDNHRRRLQ